MNVFPIPVTWFPSQNPKTRPLAAVIGLVLTAEPGREAPSGLNRRRHPKPGASTRLIAVQYIAVATRADPQRSDLRILQITQPNVSKRDRFYISNAWRMICVSAVKQL
jgi:hypothetical protein